MSGLDISLSQIQVILSRDMTLQIYVKEYYQMYPEIPILDMSSFLDSFLDSFKNYLEHTNQCHTNRTSI